jgi:hypothetical protein
MVSWAGDRDKRCSHGFDTRRPATIALQPLPPAASALTRRSLRCRSPRRSPSWTREDRLRRLTNPGPGTIQTDVTVSPWGLSTKRGALCRNAHWVEPIWNLAVDVKNIPFADTVAEKAKTELYDIRHLSPGKLAPDIEGRDQDGRQFKLSEYRGKVVLLYFWLEF